jgi:hypothetical protein
MDKGAANFEIISKASSKVIRVIRVIKVEWDSALGSGASKEAPLTLCVPGMFNNLEVKVHSQSDDDEV